MLTDEPPAPLRSVLVANRGEIAVRVIRAARDAGLRSVAVYGEPDRYALHVREADEAVALGGTDLASTYLDRSALVSAALAADADCVHPGYGFLSEDADFAQAVLDAGLVWIGPPPNTIRRLGDKVAARKIARDVGAPLAEGTTAPVRDAAEVADFARRHGFPLVIKAAFGGGGRGLKVVRDEAEIPEAFAAATREAAASCGRGECFAERFLDRARHVEAQVLADTHGTVLVVGLRDCSLQRRNQKLIEEAPAPFLTPDQEQALRRSSQRICRAAGYVSAGTVEYLLGADGTLSFLEVNTRLQVEHAVTEESTGLDLVAEQFRIAGGAALATDAPPARAHSIEFRLTAEDPAMGFLPSPGTLTRFQLPTGPGVRVDTGVVEGDTVDGRFDSMFAKLIVTGRDRTQAVGRARRALAETRIEGVHTPVSVYRQILDHPAFAGDYAFEVHNRWIEEDLDQIVLEPESAGDHLNVRVGRRLMSVHVPGLATLGDRAVAIRRESGQLRHADDEEVAGDGVTAPMNGTLVRVAVADGQSINKGDLIAIVEAMKMENPVLAHRAGTVMSLAVSVGMSVAAGTTLCTIDDSY
ncbi:MAG: biotin carboxylase N-terminal domain-containing protein [Mycobacterium sp.]|nr:MULTISPECIES: biotin carboxylase N-terminal domain-containing protein [Mycobacterium]MDZ4267107.1 biotin carboxylase N-terminal domain-containing protein [Mycobacterium sp.]MEE3066697.1 biotin carboxylase N-terminal domain-containing protein [Actinomycetota bacterium]GAY17604.1 acetyl-/propionyl-CoA carboxylase subunit alpha [Mycobacterium sp. shizuoka-1]